MVVQLAKPYDEEEAKRMLQRAQYTPRPVQVQQKEDPLIEVAKSAGANVAGKIGMKAADAGIAKGGSFLGKMFAPKATAAMGGAYGGASPLVTGLGGATQAAGATGLAGAMPMMAAAAPWLMGAAVLGKVFKLFNTGGYVGPLGNMSKVKYKTHGGDVTHEYEINMGPLSKGEQYEI